MARKRVRNKKWLWGLAGALVVVVVVVTGVVIWKVNSGDTGGGEEVVENKTDETRNKDSAVAKEKEVTGEGQDEEGKFAEEEVEKKRVAQYEGEDPNSAEELSGVITYAGVANGTLMIRVSIDQYLNEGSCKLSLKRGETVVYSGTAKVVGDVSTATCEGFDVPVSGLGGGGLEIIIDISANGKKGAIRGEVSI